MRRSLLHEGLRARALVSLLLLLCAVASGAGPPNVIVILADDLGWGDLGCYGQERIHTPRLDRMAAEGMRFLQCYAGSTVCAPSRCVLMTGKHTGHARLRGNSRTANTLYPEDVTIARLLRQGGYVNGCTGKWGLGDPGTAGVPLKQGFDSFYGFLNQQHAHNSYPTYLWRGAEERVPLRNVVPDEGANGQGVATTRLDFAGDLFADEALAFVRKQALAQKDQKDLRFFLYFAPTVPHANNEAGKKGMEVPDLGEYEGSDWPPAQKAHAAMISRLDRDIGRLLDLLDELGLASETLVLFSSDNGPHREGGNDPEFQRSSGPLRGLKRDLYEGGIRVPAIVRWPGRVPGGATSDAIWYFADILPTLCDLAGVRAPPDIDGVSIVPTLLGKPQPELSERPLYWEFHERGFQQAARLGPWKGIRKAPGEPLELYDLSKDIGERKDLAAGEPEVVRRIEAYLASARTESPDWPVQKSPR